MRYSLISYLIGDGVKNIAKNKKSTFTAITIMIVTMLTVGICLVIGENAKSILDRMENEYPIEVFIEEGTTEQEKDILKNQIKSIEYVNPDNIRFINKRDAYYIALERLGESASATEMIGYTEYKHPFPEMYVITLTNLDKLDDVVSKVEKLDHVIGTTESNNNESENKNVDSAEATLIDSTASNDLETNNTGEIQNEQIETSVSTTVKYDNNSSAENKSPAEILTKFSKSVNIALVVIGGILIAFSIIIIGNTIKLTVHARRKEISIMKYVGATNNFIRAPFVVEGIIIGLISSFISILLLGGLYVWIKKIIIGGTIQNWLKSLNNMSTGMEDLLQFEQMFPHVMTIFLMIGIGIGVLGSVLSMKKYLKV